MTLSTQYDLLTDAEIWCLTHLADGPSTAATARKMGNKPETAQSHL
ncbi:hypothetical protein [Streptomyces sp. NPDC059788]